MAQMTGILRWTPDTCPGDLSQHCRLLHHFEGEPGSLPDTWTDVFDGSEFICPAHQLIGLLAGQAHYGWILDENRRKNITQNIAGTESALVWQDGRFVWSYDEAREVLTVSFPGVALSQQARNRIQSACDLQFGPGKVVVA